MLYLTIETVIIVGSLLGVLIYAVLAVRDIMG